MIELKKITWDNWKDCFRLRVTEDQEKFVTSNMFTLAESFVALSNDELPPITLAVVNHETVIGLSMMYYDTGEEDNYSDEPYYGIRRFMIDKDHQGKGYGKKAFALVLDHIKTFPQGKVNTVYLSYEPGNTVAKHLYASFGFVETGEIDHGEAVAKLVL